MTDWRRFDIKAFLKDSKFWDERIQKLKDELDNMSELPSINNESGVRSGTPSNMTAQMALRRLQIAARIEEILLDKEMLSFALKRLTEDERELINGFFWPKKAIGMFVWEYGRKKGICKDYVYDEKDRVLEKMRDIITAEYYGE